MADLALKSIDIAQARARGAIMGFDGPYRFLSNFAASKVEMYQLSFPTVEHAFAAAKIDLKDPRRQPTEAHAEMRRISEAGSPGAAKGLGRRTLLRSDWDEVKFDLITELLRRKFSIPALRAKLAETGDAELYELNTWGDRIWGVVEKDGVAQGRNWLGEGLMLVRREILAT